MKCLKIDMTCMQATNNVVCSILTINLYNSFGHF